MRTYILIALALIVLVLQISFIPALRPFGVVPDLALVLVATAALSGPVAQAMILAIGMGFMLDDVSGSDFGLRMGLLAVAVILSAFVRRSGLQLGLRVQLAAIIFAICTIGALFAVAAIVLSGGHVVASAAISRWVFGTGITTVLALILGPVIAMVTRPGGSYGEFE